MQGLAVEWLTTCHDELLPEGLGEFGDVHEVNGHWVTWFNCSPMSFCGVLPLVQRISPSLMCGRLQMCQLSAINNMKYSAALSRELQAFSWINITFKQHFPEFAVYTCRQLKVGMGYFKLSWGKVHTAWCGSDVNHGLQSLLPPPSFSQKWELKGTERRGGISLGSLQLILTMGQRSWSCVLRRGCCMFFLWGNWIKEEQLGQQHFFCWRASGKLKMWDLQPYWVWCNLLS